MNHTTPGCSLLAMLQPNLPLPYKQASQAPKRNIRMLLALHEANLANKYWSFISAHLQGSLWSASAHEIKGRRMEHELSIYRARQHRLPASLQGFRPQEPGRGGPGHRRQMPWNHVDQQVVRTELTVLDKRLQDGSLDHQPSVRFWGSQWTAPISVEHGEARTQDPVSTSWSG